MMNQTNNLIGQSIALAAVSQAIRAVQNLAWKGQVNDTDLRAVVVSLLKVDAESPAAVYGGSFELSTGLRFLNQQLDPSMKEKDPEFANLAISVITIQNQLVKDKTLLATLGERINAMAGEFDPEEVLTDEDCFERLIERCAQTYKLTLSKLSTRIQIRGEPKYLKDEQIQLKIRAALLAAVRATFLWRQCGGSRWHFLFKKKAILDTVQNLIALPIKE